jgi:hypothetical protein
MCRRSPPTASIAGSTPLAGTDSTQELEGVDPGPVAVAPVHSESVRPNQLNRNGTDVGWNDRGVEERAATHFLDAAGTGARQPQGSSGEKPVMSLLVPFDEEPVVSAVDGVGDGVGFQGYPLFAIRSWLFACGENKKPSNSSEGFWPSEPPIADSQQRIAFTLPDPAADRPSHLPAAEAKHGHGAGESARG